MPGFVGHCKLEQLKTTRKDTSKDLDANNLIFDVLVRSIYRKDILGLATPKIIIVTNSIAKPNENEIEIRQLVETWAGAVRNRDLQNILAYHSQDIVMYDVPKPFQSRGIEAYSKTWDI